MKFPILFAVVSLIFIQARFGQTGDKPLTLKSDETKSTITYSMSHPLHDWQGESKGIKGIIRVDPTTKKLIKVAIVASVASFDSKNSNRDSHMLEITESIKYPNISFLSDSVSYVNGTLLAHGSINFHGVAKKVQIVCAETSQQNSRKFTGEILLALKDFKIEPPTIFALATKNNFNVKFEIVFK